MKEHDNLYSKIIERLNSSDVESDNQIVSAFDIRNALSDSLAFYNYLFVKNSSLLVKELNRSIEYTFVPFVRAFKINFINFFINESGEVFIVLYLNDNKFIKITGDQFSAKLYGDNSLDIDCDSFVKKNNDILRVYLGFLKEFSEKYPGVAMNFGTRSNNKNDIVINDGFMYCKIRLGNPDDAQVLFSSLDDHYVSVSHSKKYGKLDDYLGYYNNEFLKKMYTNVDELNPFVKKCVIEYLERKKEDKLLLGK